MSRRADSPLGGTLVLDCEALAKLVVRDRVVMTWIAGAEQEDLRVVTSATTLIEAWHPRVDRARFTWSVSRLAVEPVTDAIAKTASRLLSDAGLRGHKYALDAALCAVALNQQRPVVVLTSDPDDISLLGGKELGVVRV